MAFDHNFVTYLDEGGDAAASDGDVLDTGPDHVAFRLKQTKRVYDYQIL